MMEESEPPPDDGRPKRKRMEDYSKNDLVAHLKEALKQLRENEKKNAELVESRDTLLAKVSYGAVLVKQSKPGELDRDGEEVLMAAFSTAKQALGEGHEVTGKAAAELAIAFKQGGRDAEAQKLTDLARKVNVLGQLGASPSPAAPPAAPSGIKSQPSMGSQEYAQMLHQMKG